MNNFIRYVFPTLLGFGVLFYLLIVHGLSFNNPYYVYDDRLVRISFWLMIIGVIGSLIVAVKRFGVGRLKTLLTIWFVALVSLVLLYTGDDLSSLNWLLLAYPAVIVGSIMVIVNSLRNAK